MHVICEEQKSLGWCIKHKQSGSSYNTHIESPGKREPVTISLDKDRVLSGEKKQTRYKYPGTMGKEETHKDKREA